MKKQFSGFALMLLCAACGGDSGGSANEPSQTTPGTTPPGTPPTAVTLPPAGVAFDYQLGGAYDPPAGVGIVSRDRTAAASGLYDICYINGFQAQAGELDWWKANHADLLLRTAGGALVIDQDWNEALLDTSTAEKRAGLASVIGAWVQGCAAGGYDAVELDNLDSYSRSQSLLTQDDNVAMIQLLAAVAHTAHLAIAQKNSAELVGRRDEMGTDFVVDEECARYDECAAFTDAYGTAMLEIEYRRADFDQACAADHSHPIILRDVNLTPVGNRDYVYDHC